MRTIAVLTIAIVASWFAPYARAAQLIANGTPPQVAGACTSGPAWVTGGGLLANTTAAKAPDSCGFQFTASTGQSPSTLTQSDLPTVAGGTYTLSFKIEDTSPGGGSGQFNIYFDGTLIDYFREGGILVGRGYTTDSYTTGGISAFGEVNDLVANPGPSGSVLSFSATNDLGSWYVDDVSLTGPVASQAVPEPASLMAVGVALAGLGFARRRKRVG